MMTEQRNTLIYEDKIPQEIKNNQSWCLWKYEEKNNLKTKVPYNPKTDGKCQPNNKETFSNYSLASFKLKQGKYNGLGIGIFNNICAIDIDHCFDENKKLSLMAKKIIKQINSYTEKSPSGNGIRILFEVSDNFRYDKGKYYIKNSKLGLEIYVSNMTTRFVTITGNKIYGEYRNSEDNLQTVLDEYMKRPSQEPIVNRTTPTTPNYLELGLSRDKNFSILWNSTPSGFGGNESETDMALCSKLNFWLNNDEEKVYEAFMKSPYVSKKDEAHLKKLSRADYLINTIRNTRARITAYDKTLEFIQKQSTRLEEQNNNYLERLKVLSQIKRKNKQEYVYIKSGYSELDGKIGGFILGQISVWSGLNGSGKSNFLNQQIIECKIQGYKTMLFSGEIPGYSMKNILYRLVACKENLTKSVNGTYWYLADENLKDKIDKWFGTDLYIYENEFGMKAKQIIETIKVAKNQLDVNVVILDNLMTLDLGDYTKFDKYEAQSLFAKELANLAKQLNIHIHVVMHPRKVSGYLRKNDISGSADLTNAVDNVFIIHRVNNDFKKSYIEFTGKDENDNMLMRDTAIEICKNREEGIQDEMVGLYFQKETKQFTTYKYDEKRYIEEVEKW